MYPNSVTETQMSWRENPQWQTRNIAEKSGFKTSIRDATHDCSDGARLETMLANAPLDLSVFPDSKQSRNAESPLDLSCKTRKRCADSTEERQFGFSRAAEHSAEKKLKNSHIRYETSNVRTSNEGTFVDKHYKQNQQFSNSFSTGNGVQVARQNCIKGAPNLQPGVKQFSAAQSIGRCVPGLQQNIPMKYPSASGAKVTQHIDKNIVHQRQGNIASVQNDKMTLKQDGRIGLYQGQQQHGRTHIAQTNRISQQHSVLRTQQQQQQLHQQQQQQQQRIIMQQGHSNVHSQSALISQHRNELKPEQHNDLVQQSRRMAAHHFYHNQRQHTKDTSLSSHPSTNQCNNFMQQQEKQYQQHNGLSQQYSRHVDHSSSAVFQPNDQDAAIPRSSAMSKIEDRKTCIQQPMQYHNNNNMTYIKQQMAADMPQNTVPSKPQSSMPHRQESVKQMNNAQCSMSHLSNTSGSYYSHPHQIYPNRYQTIQRCSPDSTNVPSLQSDARCDKLDAYCSEKQRQYSPSVRRTISNAYPQNIDFDTRNNMNSKFSVATAPITSSEIYAQSSTTSMKTSFTGSNIPSNRSPPSSSTSFSSSHNKQSVCYGNVRAGSRQESPTSLKGNASYSLNSSPLTYQSNIPHSTSYHGAQRSIVNGTSGITKPPSVEIISQYNPKTSNCDSSDQTSLLQSGKTISGPNSYAAERRNSIHLPFSKYSRTVDSPKIKMEKESIMSHLYSQVEKEVNSDSVKTEDVMSHLFSQVESELNAAHETEELSKPITGSITDAYKNRKDSLEVENGKEVDFKNSRIAQNSSSVQSNIVSNETVKDENSTKEGEKFSSPLSISIPNSGANGSDNTQNSIVKNESETKQIKCLSKKQLILNAVNKDEGLKKIVASVGQKPKQRTLSPSDRIASHNNHNPSPTFPESPKMPTLSPQQKLPTPVVSPLISEPPTLDPAATTGYRHHRIDSKITLLRKPQSVNNEGKQIKPTIPNQSTFKSNADVSGNKQEYAIQGLNPSAFTKRPSMLQKRIPVANVAPMVHRNIQDSADSVQDSNDQLEKLDDSSLKSSAKIGTSNQILPFSTDIQSYNVSRSPVLNKSHLEDPEIESHIENETFSLFCEKSDPSMRLSPLMKKKVFQRQYTNNTAAKTKQTTSKTVSSIKENKLLTKKPIELRQRQRQRDSRIDKNIGSPRNPVKQKVVEDQQDCDSPSKKSKLSPQCKKQTSKNIEESSGIVIHTKRKAWMSLNKARHHMQLRRSNVGEIASETSLKRGESLRTRKRRTHLRRNALKLCKPVNAKRAQALENTKSESVELENQNNEDADKNRDGMWEVTGSGSTLRNGKPKGGLMLKLFFRPKKKRRFTRKQRRRPRRRINVKTAKTEIKNVDISEKVSPVRRRKGGLKSRSKFTGNVDESALQQEEESFSNFDGSQDCYSEFDVDDSTVTGDYFVPAEVKRLAVCKDTGETPLHRAARMGHLDVAVYCLKSGRVEVNAKDNAGYTPLHECSVSGHMGIARLLLSYGANVNCSSQDGIRPVHDAVENDHIEIVRLLMTFGADPTISTYTGRTPLKIARSRKMQLLIKGHLGDLNGFEFDHEEYVWDIPSQFLAQDDKYVPETNIFLDIPPDPELETDDDMFQEFSEPTFSLFKAPCSTHKDKYEDCVLLRDVTDYYKVNSVAIEKTSGVKSSINISKDQLLCNSLDFLLYDRILSIPGSSCRLLKSQELLQIIQKCERRNVRKYVRKSKSIENNQKPNCLDSSYGKKRKNSKKSSSDSVHLNDSKQTTELEIIQDGADGVLSKESNCKSALWEEEDTQEIISEDSVKACKKIADNNNVSDMDYMAFEEDIQFGSTPDCSQEDELDISTFLSKL